MSECLRAEEDSTAPCAELLIHRRMIRFLRVQAVIHSAVAQTAEFSIWRGLLIQKILRTTILTFLILIKSNTAKHISMTLLRSKRSAYGVHQLSTLYTAVRTKRLLLL